MKQTARIIAFGLSVLLFALFLCSFVGTISGYFGSLPSGYWSFWSVWAAWGIGFIVMTILIPLAIYYSLMGIHYVLSRLMR